MGTKVLGIDVKAEIALTYDVEPTLWEGDGGDGYLVDRVLVEFFFPPDEGDDDPYYIRVQGWRTTSSGRPDRRQRLRDTVLRKHTEKVEFLRDTLGISYVSDITRMLDAT